jgi:hypothetical protein
MLNIRYKSTRSSNTEAYSYYFGWNKEKPEPTVEGDYYFRFCE